VSALRGLDQRRAAAAYAYAAMAADLDRARKLPAMLQINGLLATWAFFLSNDETAILDALLGHLRSLPELAVPAGGAEAVFLHWVGGPAGADGGIEGSLLRALTAEALAWSVWLKRAAEARAENGAPHA
jgi:CRISPR/Cas system CMR-associated protein Cmr5 small subunit